MAKGDDPTEGMPPRGRLSRRGVLAGVGGTVLAAGMDSQPAAAQTTPVTFAVIGDYGMAGQPSQDVARLVKGWHPDFIVTLGDNNYEKGTAATIDLNVGQYYHDYIYPYRGN